MAQIKFNDEKSDNAVWQCIKQSNCIKDYESYMSLFADALHDTQACENIDRLLHDPTPDDIALPLFQQGLIALSELTKSDDSSSQFHLGKSYALGIGTKSDWGKAFRHYSVSGLQGDPRGYHNIARAYYWGESEQRDYLKAAEYFEKAYKIKHDTLTVLFLAKMHIYGYGYEKDTAKGIDLLLHEIDHGDTYALALLGNLLKSGDGVPADVHAGLQHIRCLLYTSDAADE